MWADDIKDNGFKPGTFQLGQRVYHITTKNHYFHLRKKCDVCDCTGEVLIKGRSLKCPVCNGGTELKQVTEYVVSDLKYKVESILSFRNKTTELEVYTNDSTGLGVIIYNDESNPVWFTTKEEAQAVCDTLNRENSVYLLLEEYNRQKLQQ